MKKWLRALVRRTKGEKGVTLIELLAVIVIIAVIAAIAVPVVLSSINKSKINTAMQDMSVIAEALNRYATDNNGQYPASNGWEELDPTKSTVVKDLVTGDSTTSYLQSMPVDPWDSSKHFYYYSNGTGFELETYSANSSNGTGTGDKDLYFSNHMTQPSHQKPQGNDGQW